jgi:wyosine [tRNA(Phe)-imidazoG37] synthetase (radical SAM superfamily)
VLQDILDGIFVFAQTFTGELVTETMLVRGVNDDMANLKAIASFLERLRPIRAYISMPTRPPAEIWSRSPTEEAIHQAYQIFKKHVKNVEFLIDYEGNDFAITGDAAKDLLSITAVHPMRQDAVTTFLQTAGVNEPLVENLIKQGLLTKKIYHGHYYYLRRFPMVTEKEVSR